MLNVAISGATGTESYWLDMYHGEYNLVVILYKVAETIR